MIYLNPGMYKKVSEFHAEKLEPWITKRLKYNEKLLPVQLKKYILENLHDILAGTPDVLLEKNNEFYTLMGIRKNKYIKERNQELKKIFSYELFSEKKKKQYDAYDLAGNLNINTCTYCNRLYTITVVKGVSAGEHITRPQFDHYFSKSEYPLLALSFYNLIPSCAVCNSTLKGDQNFSMDTHIHPYVDDCINNFRFSFTPDNTSSLKGRGKNLQVTIETDSDKDKKLVEKIHRTFDVFKIIDTYNGHTDEVRDLILLKEVMSEKYLEILKKTYKLTISDDELYRLAFGAYQDESEFHKRPFSKLKKDLLKELGII